MKKESIIKLPSPNTLELHFGKGRSLRLLSYAVYGENRVPQVSHETTRGYSHDDLKAMVDLELERNSKLRIV